MSSMDSLVNLLAPVDGRQGRFYGVAVGIVTNIGDPEELGRVKVKFPWLSEEDESRWARIVSPMGTYFLPKVEDEVLVVFDHGDMNFPYILGGLWNGKDALPFLKEDADDKDKRKLKSRSGHTIVLDDTENGEKLILESSSGHTIVLDDTKDGEKIVISDKTQKNTIEIDSKNNTMTIAVEKDLIVKAKGKISVEAETRLDIKCSQGVKINDGALEVK